MAIKANSAFSTNDIATGDPIKCESCEAILNMYSSLKHEEKDSYTWICEYCGEINHVDIDLAQIPKLPTASYPLEKLEKPIPIEELKTIDDITVIFCIDVSGSMDMAVKTAVDSKYSKLKGCISRLECVKLAIDQQINDLLTKNKGIKIGFVTFEHKVKIIGDGSKPMVTLGEDIYKNYEALFEASSNLDALFASPIEISKDFLFAKLKDMETGGSTALGPGLLASVAIAAKGKPGSKVILCTDGMANIGLGAVDNAKKAAEATPFYEKLGKLSKEKGINISLISLVQKECRLELISPVANMTGGTIMRVDPQSLDTQFKELLKDRIIATNVTVKVRMHKALEFANEVIGTVMGSTMVREIGNATGKTEMTFEYQIRPLEEVKKIPNFNIESMKSIPVQGVVTFKTVEGMKMMKVVNIQIPVTFNEEEYMKKINQKLIATHSNQTTAQLAQLGRFKDARKNMMRFKPMTDVHSGIELEPKFTKLDKALEKQELIEEKAKEKESKCNVADEMTEAINYGLFDCD
jgi:hypothetical protein